MIAKRAEHVGRVTTWIARAECSCGWTGTRRDSTGHAEVDLARHIRSSKTYARRPTTHHPFIETSLFGAERGACGCGWHGPDRDTIKGAEDDALEHMMDAP
jgi:hypothetical protein